MSIEMQIDPTARKGFMAGYLEALAMVERLHRLLLDVIKDEFERVGVLEINAVQALLLFNIGDNEVTAGELKSRIDVQQQHRRFRNLHAGRKSANAQRIRGLSNLSRLKLIFTHT